MMVFLSQNPGMTSEEEKTGSRDGKKSFNNHMYFSFQAAITNAFQ